ncbi:MAG: TlpA family protein disulfide reductase [Planctomycetota bacterium]
MSEQQKQCPCRWLIIISVIMLAVVIIWTGCKKQPAELAQTEHSGPKPAQSEPVTKPVQYGPLATPKVSLRDIIRAARTWRPAYTSWYGKPAPDFTLADLAGKKHKLSDYRGKDVLLVFWATWCPPCKREIPGLIELRRTVGEDKLAMLAISDETLGLVKRFVGQAKINYTVLTDPGVLPGPYNTINSIPCSFFINPEGKIKLASSGLMSLGEIKAVLQAL